MQYFLLGGGGSAKLMNGEQNKLVFGNLDPAILHLDLASKLSTH